MATWTGHTTGRCHSRYPERTGRLPPGLARAPRRCGLAWNHRRGKERPAHESTRVACDVIGDLKGPGPVDRFAVERWRGWQGEDDTLQVGPRQVAGVEHRSLSLVGADQNGAQVGQVGMRDRELDAELVDRERVGVACDR